MRTKKHIIINITRTIVLTLCLLLLATCEVGLGSTIDTNVPTVSITSPTPSQVIKGAFSLGGVATDDGGIANVIVDFTGIGSSEGTNYNFEASVADGKWSLSVNSVGSVADGTYQLKVTANDKSGKTSYQMTTFTVDNTAPVILVTSPDEKTTSLSYDLQFEGKIYDATEIDGITVNVYDATGNVKFSKAATLMGTSEWKVSVDGETELLIGTALAKLVNGDYTYAVTASDKVGNSSTYFFHKEDIYKKYTKNRLSIDEWAAFDKGDKTTVSDVALDRTEWLPSIRIPANPATAYEDKAKFTYSDKPVASIVWNNISGETYLNNGDSIIGSITPPTGSDSPFRNDSFKCYIWKKEDTSGNLIANYNPDTDRVDNNKITITNIGTARSFAISTEGLGGGSYGIYIEIKNSSDSLFSDTQTFGINLGTPQLTINVPTLSLTTNDTSFALSGKALTSTGDTGCRLEYDLTITDEDGNSSTETHRLLPVYESDSTWSGDWALEIPDTDGTYAYVFTASSGDHQSSLSRTITLDTTNPTVKITSISQTDDASSIKVTGTASDNLSTLAKLEYCFIPKNSTPVDSDWKEPSGKAFYNWTINISNPVVNETTNELKYPEGEYTFQIRVTDVAGNVSSLNESDPSETDETKINKPKKDITVDRADPQLTVSVEGDNWSWKTRKDVSIQVVETHFANTFVNSDGENAYGLTVKLGDGNAEPLSLTQDGADASKWMGTWTPPENIEDGTYSVTFTVTDTVGKTTTEKKTFVIDQDGPKLVVLNLEDGAVYTTGKTEAAPLTVMGTVTDSPAGVKSLSYKVNSGEYVQAYPNDDYTTGVPLNWSIDISGLNEGENTISIKAVDNSDNPTIEDYSSIIVDTTAPELKDVFAEYAPTYITVGGDAFKIITATEANTIVAEDAIAIASFKVEATKDNTPQKSTTDANGHVVGEDASDDECWYSLTGISNTTPKKTLAVGDLDIPDFEGTIGNGVWVVTVTVKDKSGWEARKIYRFTVDTTAPVVRTIADIDAPKDMGAAPVSYMFSGTADDVDNSGSQVQKIEVAFTNKNGTIVENSVNAEDNTVIKTASGQTNWSYNLVFNDSAESNFNSVFTTEGEKDIHVRAIDIAGNIGEWKTATFLYDKSAPSISIISYQKENDASETDLTSASFNSGKKFTLTGKAFDSYDGIASVEVYQKNGSPDDEDYDTVPAVKIATISEFTDLGDGWNGWSVINLPREIITNGEGTLEATSNASVVDGKYTYYAVAMDKSGVTKTTEENGETVSTNIPGKTTKSSDITVTVDTTSPNVSITSPDSTRTGATSLYGSSSIFSIFVEDPGTTAVRASELRYVFVKAKVDDFETYTDPEPPATEPVLVSPNPAVPDIPVDDPDNSVWQSMNISDGSWSITQSLASGAGTTAVNAVCSTNTLNEGHWYLFVKALDKAGNESEVASIHFHVDMSVPSISNVTVNDTNAVENKTYYTNGTSFVLAGKATDTYGVKSVKIATSYTWIENTGTEENPEETPHEVTTDDTITEFGADDSWTKTIDVSADTAKDTPVFVTVTVTDKAGKKTESNYTLYRDTVAPEVTAISPANTENLNSNKIKLKGTVVDAGSGTASVSYVITREGDAEFSRTDSNIIPVGESWSVPTEINLGEGEGTFTLIVTAVDKVGNTSGADSLTTRTNEFYVDTANPKIKETGINTASKMVKSWFTLSGFVYDSNSLNKDEAVVISAEGISDVKFKLPNGTAADAIAMTEASTAEKLAQKVALGLTDLTDEDVANQTWYKWSKTFCVDSEVAGEDGVPTGATHLDDGTYVFSITANDVASKTDVVQRTITVDTNAPVFTEHEFEDETTHEIIREIIDYSETGSDNIADVEESDGNGGVVNVKWFSVSVINVKMLVDDAPNGSGLSTVKYLSHNGDPTETKTGFFIQSSEVGHENEWSATIPLSEGINNRIRIIATDNAGNETFYPDNDYEPIHIDTTNPTVTITNSSDLLTNGDDISTTDVVEKEFSISGSATDTGSGVASVTATVTKTDGTIVNGTFTMNNSTSGGIADDGSWSITFSTPNALENAPNKLSEDGAYTITITATDKAGCSSSKTKNVTIDTKPAKFISSSFTTDFHENCGSNRNETWYGSTSLEIIGSFTDANEIDSVRWSWTNDENSTWRSLDKSISGDDINGYTCSFSGSVPVPTTLKNASLYIKATDKAGNVGYIDAFDVGHNDALIITGINVDLGNPTVELTEQDKELILNGKKDIEITVKAEDLFSTTDNNGNPIFEVASGIKNVKLRIGNSTFTDSNGTDLSDYSVENTGENGKGNGNLYTLTIARNVIESLGNNNVTRSSVYIQAEDNTGKTSVISRPFQIDTKPPTAEISSPYTDTTINKEIHFTGRANDDQNLLVVNLYYSTAKTSPGIPVAESDNPAEINVWKRPMPTEEQYATLTDEEIEEVKETLEAENLDTEIEEAKEKWVLFKTFEGATGYNWDEIIDTEDVRYNNPELETINGIQVEIPRSRHVRFMAEAFDAAYNSEAKSRAVSSCIIDQLSDCPVLTFNRVEVDGFSTLKGTKTIDGTVTDDDGDILELRVSTNKDTTWAENNSDSYKCTIRNGISWEYTFPDTDSEGNVFQDGWKTLYFRIKDKEGNYFYTKKADDGEDVLDGIYLEDSTKRKVMGALTFRIDRYPPQIIGESIKIYQRNNNSSNNNPTKHYTELGDEAKFSSDMFLGGTNNVVDFFAYAIDNSGIDSMSIKIGNNEEIPGVGDGTDVEGHNIWKVSGNDGIDVSKNKFADGPYTLIIKATDGTETESEYSTSIRIDNTAPTFSIDSPTFESHVKGDVTIRGDASDAHSNEAGTKVTGIGVKRGNLNEGTNKYENTGIQYTIPALADRDDGSGDGTYTSPEYHNWHDMTLIGNSIWQIVFKDDDQLENYVKATVSNDSDERKYVKSNECITEGGSTYWKVPIYFRMEDELGNVDFKTDYYLYVDPDGDRPTAEITYPANVNGNPTSLSGTIRIFGSAEDNVAVDAVFMRIDVDGDGKFTGKFDFGENGTHDIKTIGFTGDEAENFTSDTEYLGTKGFNFVKVLTENIKTTKYENDKGYVFGTDTDSTDDDWWGIKVNGKESWSQKLKGSDLPSTNPIEIQVLAMDNNCRIGGWSDGVKIKIDTDVPEMGSMSLVQYNNGNVDAIQDYQDGISITGNWELVGSATDSNGIASITAVIKDDGTPMTVNYTPTNTSSPVEFKIPITTDGSGTLQFTITVTDGSEEGKITSQLITIKYDNSAPEFEGDLTHNSYVIGDEVEIEQSNKTYNIEGFVKDEGSGFSRIAIFFKRTIGSESRIYNPALSKGSTGNKIVIDNDNVKLVNDLPTTKSITVTRDGESKLVLPGSVADDVKANIRTGGLVRIGGVYRLITDVTGNTVTFTPSVSEDQTEAEFVLALVIDNFKTETRDDEHNRIINDDGDEVIESIELETGTKYKWSISIDSKQIPDGPIVICCIAFDKAGLMSTLKTVQTNVWNNRPAIANVWLGTDYNKDTYVKENEFARSRSVVLNTMDRYNYDENWKNSASNVNIDVTNEFKAVGVTVIKPEVVGGNAPLNYYYAKDTGVYTKIGSSTTNYIDLSSNISGSSVTFTANVKTPSGTNVNGCTYDWYVDNEKDDSSSSESFTKTFSKEGSYTVKVVTNEYLSVMAVVTVNADGVDSVASATAITEYPITLGLLGDGSNTTLDGMDNGVHTVKIKIYDSTDTLTGDADSISDNNSQFAELSVKFRVKVVDDTPPKSTIDEFHWKNRSDNSVLYFEDDITKELIPEGHIELKPDLPADSFNEGSGEYDNDPKVSGIIRIQGKAFDETCLQSIGIKITGGSSGTSPFTFKVGDSPVPTGKNKNYTDTGFAVLSTFQGIKNWSDTGDLENDGYHFFVTDTDEDLSNGHEVIWELDFDTSRINNVADKDIVVSVMAFDTFKNTSDENTVSDAFNKMHSYKMDVVPYISSVTTALSSLKTNNPSVFARTSLGHYPVASTETIKLEGFNLEGGIVKFILTHETLTEEATYVQAIYDPVEEGYAIPSTAKSGEISITVNNMKSLNNENKNDGKGSYNQDVGSSLTGNKSIYENYYNRQPNGDNNNLLTDDVVLDIWEIDPTAVKPKSGAATQPVMQIDPLNGHIGFAFVNGSVSFSMPRGTGTTLDSIPENSYEYWIGGLDFWNSVCFTYDKNGYVYGVAAGGDLNASKHGVDTFRLMTSRWNQKGSLKTDGYADANGQFGIEFIGEREYAQNESNQWYGYTNFSKKRIKSPSMVAVGSDNATKSTLYLAYYDSINDEVRFKWGEITNSKDTSDDVGMFANDYDPGTRFSQPYSISHSSLIAGQTIGKMSTTQKTNKDNSYENTISPVSTPVTTTTGVSVYGGEYVDIAVIPGGGSGGDDAVVAVWWDGTHHKMLYSFNKKPKSIQKGEYLQVDTEWSSPVELFGAEVGEYCKVTADKIGGIHIAAYDSLNGDLWYAYVPQFDNPKSTNTKIGCVDSYGFVGNELNIDVVMDSNGSPKPYISYYALSCSHPKIAYWSGTVALSSTSSVIGVENEAYTDKWDITVIPTDSKTSIDHVNVGLWKDSDGKAKESITGVTRKVTTNDNGATKNSYGFVYGNGTANPVISYANESGNKGYIETAQMK